MVADGQSVIHTSPPECERFRGDIAVFVIGALDGVERARLLNHLDGCPQCDALRDELSETARALEALRPCGALRCLPSGCGSHIHWRDGDARC
jgi:hypothetical protein